MERGLAPVRSESSPIRMRTDLRTTLTGLRWIVDAYVLAVAMLLLAGGVAADRFGRKRVFLGGVAVFTIASPLCSTASTVDRLLAGRVLQGIGAAVLSPAGLALLASAYPVPKERIKAIGLWAGLSGIGMAAGPVMGGVLTNAFGRRRRRRGSRSTSPLTGAAISAVPPREGGPASGISGVTPPVGAVFGVAVPGAVVRTRQTHGGSFATGLDTAFLTAGALTLATAALTFLWLVRPERARPLR